jgi:hypothetical protein
MKKTLTREITICDFCDTDVDAVGVVQPSGKDVCAKHYAAFMEEVRLPEEMNEEMSGLRLPVDPGFNVKMKIVYKEEKK